MDVKEQKLQAFQKVLSACKFIKSDQFIPAAKELRGAIVILGDALSSPSTVGNPPA